jgi:hypothetical protein
MLLSGLLEHRFDLIDSDGILAEAWLSQNWHSRIRTDSLELSSERAQVILFDVLLLKREL